MDTEYGQSIPADTTPSQQPPAPQPPPAAPAPPGYQSGRQPMPGLPPAPPPPPPPPWGAQHEASWYGQGWPGGPGGPYAMPPAPPGKPGRKRRAAITAAAVAALGLAAGGTAVAAANSGSSALTTAEIAAKTNPGVVDVISTMGFQGGIAEGTGMVLTSNGEVLTNNHVIDGATSIKVRDIGNGRTYTAKVVGYSNSNDVAVLQLTGASGLSTVSLGNSSGLSAGQRVVALGNAEGKGGTPAVAAGKITGLGATITAQNDGNGALEHLSGMIRTNANIEPGDSGGPLVNAAGQVVGMDTAASTTNSGQTGTTAAVQTTAFAIPINHALAIADQIEAGKASATVHIGTTAFLGVGVSSTQSSASQAGVPVAGVINGTAAAQAGLAQGDTITSVGGHQVSSDPQLQTVMSGYHPGDKVNVSWTDQAGQTHQATLTLGNGPAA